MNYWDLGSGKFTEIRVKKLGTAGIPASRDTAGDKGSFYERIAWRETLFTDIFADYF